MKRQRHQRFGLTARATRATMLVLTLVVVMAGSSGCQGDSTRQSRPTAAAGGGVRPDSSAAMDPLTPPPAPADEQRRLVDQAARTAWAYVARNYSTTTGLVRALDSYRFVTVWDMASTLAAYRSARDLGLIDSASYDRRVRRALATLEKLPVFNGAAFNKFYDSQNGLMIDRKEARTSVGYGWSALDLGRLLVMLKVIATRDPRFADAAQKVVSRLAMDRIVVDGYLKGSDIEVRSGKIQVYQEGRIGYEQYAAEGFAAWGASADHARDFRVNAVPVKVGSVEILGDKRGDDLLTSEPFIMMGLELGWPTDEWRAQARRVFDAQHERFKQTGVMTMLSEDAVPEPPSFFYYYLLYRNGTPFVITQPGGGPAPDALRWISTKAAFGWHALFPSDYSWRAIQVVRPAGSSGRGWTAGVYERSKRPTRSFNLNTAALVLESAAYFVRRCPLIAASCATPATPAVPGGR